MLYYAEISSFTAINSEIEKILFTDNLNKIKWTYSLIKPELLAEAKR